MNILISNDDGIQAEGIHRLAEALSAQANIYICAPHKQRSACGHGITVNRPITMTEVPFQGAQKAMEITGTPADCVKLGLKVLQTKGIGIDMMFSGINHGGNLGTDTLYSGTVSAAIEGSICGLPSVAVSVNDHKPDYFGLACELAVKACQKAYGKMSHKTVLNINTPNLPPEKIKGVKVTRLGAREYNEWFLPKTDEEGNTAYWYSGEPVIYRGLPDDIDVIAMQDGYATITPLHYDLTSYDLMEEVWQWGIAKNSK